MTPAERIIADAVKDRLGQDRWLYVAPDASVAVVEVDGNVPVRRYNRRSLLAALADAYDDLHVAS